MRIRSLTEWVMWSVLIFVLILAAPARVLAHCDGLDGPVVKAAQAALDSGEGEPYTGFKPAGRDFGPAIPAADKAVEVGAIDPVVKLLTHAVEEGIRAHFKEVFASRRFKPGDLAAGREYVKAYVEFIHYVERLHEASTTGAHGHFPEP